MNTHPRVSPLVSICVLGAAFLLGGCQHALSIKNLDTYRAAGVVSEKPVSVGLFVKSSDEPSGRLGDGIAAGLRNASTDVLYPYAPNSPRTVDVQADVSIAARYEGSGGNFLVNFPGFLVFAPAWNGYIYKVNYDVSVSLKRSAGLPPIEPFSIPVRLDVRHADFNRTWTEISWLEVGVIAFVGGVAFTEYDSHVSPLAADSAKTTVGAYIAREIVKKINALPLKTAPANP